MSGWRTSEAVAMCTVCAGAMVLGSQGRPRLYCSAACRQKAHRLKKHDAHQLEDRRPPMPVKVEGTPAMSTGDQQVYQCAWCGCVVVTTGGRGAPTRGCPSCDRPDQGWWRQELPLAGLRSPGA